jgi:hypothetical protein
VSSRKAVLVRLRQEHDRVPLGWCVNAAPLAHGRGRLSRRVVVVSWHQCSSSLDIGKEEMWHATALHCSTWCATADELTPRPPPIAFPLHPTFPSFLSLGSFRLRCDEAFNTTNPILRTRTNCACNSRSARRGWTGSDIVSRDQTKSGTIMQQFSAASGLSRFYVTLFDVTKSDISCPACA